MREFFKTELKNLHLTTGLQQYFKLSSMPNFDQQFKMLLDLLVATCKNFPLIPDEDKKAIVKTYMIQDADFQGFNPKILWKWFNIENRKYLPASQSQFDEQVSKRVEHTPEQQMKIDALIEQWKEETAKAGVQTARTDGIKDQRIQVMKDNFNKIECKHPFMFNGLCLDCGKELSSEERTNAKDVTPKEKVLSQGKSQFTEDMLSPEAVKAPTTGEKN